MWLGKMFHPSVVHQPPRDVALLTRGAPGAGLLLCAGRGP